MATIESSAAQLCAYVNDDPTDKGVVEGLSSLQTEALTKWTDAVVITALHHVCPQHQELVMNSMIPFAEEV